MKPFTMVVLALLFVGYILPTTIMTIKSAESVCADIKACYTSVDFPE